MSGHFQCGKELGKNGKHDGECETEDKPVLFPFGPFTDAGRGRAYLRGFLDCARGGEIDFAGQKFKVERIADEHDADYGHRVWSAAQ